MTKIPVTLLSGFLGSGKTTLLERILKNKNNLKCAVIVNDMAPLNIDASLVKRHNILQKEEKLIELQNGCICCTLREDLLEEITKLANEGSFDFIVIESSGVAEPMQVAETFTFTLEESEKNLWDICRLDCCVTVVDCSSFLDLFQTTEFVGDRFGDDHPEAEIPLCDLLCDQIEFSNVILLNKIDLVSKSVVSEIKNVIEKMNPNATLIESVYSDIDLTKVLNTNLFDFERAALSPGWLKSMNEEHVPETLEYGIGSFVYRARKPFHPERLFDLLDSIFVLIESPPSERSDPGYDSADEESEEGDDEEEDSFDDCKDSEDDLTEDEEIEAFIKKENEEKLERKSSKGFKNCFRSKGFIWLATRPKRIGEWSQAGMMLTISDGGLWFCEKRKEEWTTSEIDLIQKDMMDEEAVGDRRQELVFIGQFSKNEDIEKIKNELDNCLCTPLELEDIENLYDPFEVWSD